MRQQGFTPVQTRTIEVVICTTARFRATGDATRSAQESSLKKADTS
jgi:hypothetical protein